MLSKKKSSGQMTFYIVALILALIFLVIMSYMSNGIVKKFMRSIGAIQEKTDDDAECQVLFEGINDEDGDGLHDTKKRSDGTPCDPDAP